MVTDKDEKSEVIEKIRKHERDTGSTEVQIGLLTERINKLTSHFEIHKKDHHSRRGLLKMISRRRKLLDYLRKSNFPNYRKVLKTFNLRK